jgi:protein TonB
LPAYRPSTPYEHPPLRRRASGFALALGVNLLLLLVLLGIGKFAPMAEKPSRAIIVNLVPESRSSAAKPSEATREPTVQQKPHALPKPPRIVLPVKPTIAPPPAEKPLPWIEMSKEEMAASDISKMPKTGSGSAGDSEEVGRGPNGEVLYAAEWARRPTDAELGGYLPRNAPDGWGLIACKTIPGDRVEDCIELGQDPPGSHLASAVRQAAWQFRVRPPRKNGRPMVGSWVRIRIDYTRVGG